MIVAPSILSADFSRLGDQLKEVEKSHAQWIHFDVFDGHFVPNISFGTDVLKAVKSSVKMYVDVHLVISDPEYYSDIFMNAGADGITFHLDAVNSIEKSLALINKIKARGKKVGITVYPEADMHEYLPYLDEVDLALVMSIKPGFGGQPFREDAIERIKWLNDLRKKHNYHYLIQVDGGINAETGGQCAKAGADVLVAGSYVFKNNIPEAVDTLYKL
ncbi:ribulose-phosphate 3-epimerase [Parablautia sp. Marseille-Q6255]|uniref:ribulose-phosphate 3-epimerase n=1 Tax=Parablautia sp. Marseille-Q6255 TaxID=3039593 RepID=UPI0024BCC4F7|nr:ribulose-phosphate 3-epimerase [Parablautia sp. Marseille-Q6255]